MNDGYGDVLKGAGPAWVSLPSTPCRGPAHVLSMGKSQPNAIDYIGIRSAQSFS